MKQTNVTAILIQKIQKKQAIAKKIAEKTCVQECDLSHNHKEKEVFFGKKLAAAFQGLSLAEAMRPAYPKERRNNTKRNMLSIDEENQLHQARRALREMQPAA